MIQLYKALFTENILLGPVTSCDPWQWAMIAQVHLGNIYLTPAFTSARCLFWEGLLICNTSTLPFRCQILRCLWFRMHVKLTSERRLYSGSFPDQEKKAEQIMILDTKCTCNDRITQYFNSILVLLKVGFRKPLFVTHADLTQRVSANKCFLLNSRAMYGE